jgi:hypothetical protein
MKYYEESSSVLDIAVRFFQRNGFRVSNTEVYRKVQSLKLGGHLKDGKYDLPISIAKLDLGEEFRKPYLRKVERGGPESNDEFGVPHYWY